MYLSFSNSQPHKNAEKQYFSLTFITSLISTFVTTFMLFSLLSGFSGFANAQTVRTLAVTGEAEKQVTPNAFSMSVTFEQKGQDLVSVKSNVDEQVGRATDLLMANGVDENNIRSMDVTVYPWVENEQRQQVNKGFVYRRSVFFTHDDIQAYDELIKKVAALKPQQIGQLSLLNKNIELIERALLKEALADARRKGEEMAATLDMELGHVLFMSDGTRPPHDMLNQRSGDMMMAESKSSVASLAGENTMRTSVQVVFEIHTISSRPK